MVAGAKVRYADDFAKGAVMNKFKRLQDELLSAVGQQIEEFGFDKRPKSQEFSKKTPFGQATFHLAFIKHEDDFDVTADIGIRFDQVEELVNRDDKLLTKSDKAETYTIGSELGNLSEDRQKRWTVASADDVPILADSVTDSFRKVALPYVENFSDAKRVLEILSGDGPDSWLHSPLHDARAKRAVCMALTMYDEDVARKLAKAKLLFLEQRKDFGLSSFRAFLENIGFTTSPPHYLTTSG